MNLSGKKILVTGGEGFIGQNLVRKLLSYKAAVVSFDFVNNQDITNYHQVKSFVKKNFNAIFHLAGFSGALESNKKQFECFNINTLGSLNLYELICQYAPNTKLVVSSSRLEYGTPKYLPVDENHPTNPTSMYGLSKLAATQLALIYNLKNNLDVTVFRTSNVYGPHTSSQFRGYNLINYFIDQAKHNKALTVYGDGSQERDYIYIDDLIEAFILAYAKNSSGAIYNLGFGQGIKIKDMAGLIIKKIGMGRIKFAKWPQDLKIIETGSYISNITNITKELNFKPRISFEKGVAMAIKSQ